MHFFFQLAALLQLVEFVYATIPPRTGWTLAFADDFNGAKGQLPDQSRWLLRTGRGNNGWGNQQVQTYTRNTGNVRTDGAGNLWIVPLRSNTGQWTSGRIETRRADFVAPAGGKMIIEARISMPGVNGANGLGYWPAFWTLGGGLRHGGVWPKIGEFDIMENVNGVNSVWQGLHCDVNPGGVCDEPVGLVNPSSCAGSSCQGIFHTYTVEIDRSVQPEVMRYATDGVVHRTITSSQVGTGVWNQIAHNGQFLILDVAMGGAFPNAVASKTTPTGSTIPGKPLRAQYVAVWYQH